MLRQGGFEPGELEHVPAHRIHLRFKHCPRESGVKQMHHRKVVKLGMLPVFALVELMENPELLQSGVEVRPVHSCWVITDILEPRRVRAHLVNFLENNPQELGDQSPAQVLTAAGCGGAPPVFPKILR